MSKTIRDNQGYGYAIEPQPDVGAADLTASDLSNGLILY